MTSFKLRGRISADVGDCDRGADRVGALDHDLKDRLTVIRPAYAAIDPAGARIIAATHGPLQQK
jgi:hypothetical protein